MLRMLNTISKVAAYCYACLPSPLRLIVVIAIFTRITDSPKSPATKNDLPRYDFIDCAVIGE